MRNSQSIFLTREKLTVELFGRTRFWIGILLGLATTLILYFFFAYGREILRGTTAYSGDLLIPTKKEFILYNLFFSAASITTGFGMTAWFWFQNPTSFKISKRWNQFIRLYLITSTLTLLIVILRTGNFVFLLLYGLDGYDNHLNFVEEMPELLALIPIVFFLNIWTPIRLKYRSGKWFLYSIVLFFLGTIILAASSPIDQSKMNDNWNRLNAPFNNIVDSEIMRAKSNGVTISPQTVETLRFKRKQRVINLASLLKDSFKQEKSISTDLIVVELILMKKTTLRLINNSNRENEEEVWPYVLPKDVYRQIMLSNDSIKTHYLKEILLEINDIFKRQEKEPWELGEQDGLYDKYENRSFMQWWYKDIEVQAGKYRDSLNNR